MDGQEVISDRWCHACWLVRKERVCRSRNISMRIRWNKNTWWYCVQKYTEAILCVLGRCQKFHCRPKKFHDHARARILLKTHNSLLF